MAEATAIEALTQSVPVPRPTSPLADLSDDHDDNDNDYQNANQLPRFLHSHSSSFEADDERSATGGPCSVPSTAANSIHKLLPAASSSHQSGRRQSDSSSDYHPGQPFRNVYRMATGEIGGGTSRRPTSRRVSRRGRRPSAVAAYADEDNRPTSSREILGWYTYSFASETYVICGS